MSAELTSVAYKKGNLMRYSIWAVAIICLVLGGVLSAQMLNAEFSPDVPENYNFAVSDPQTESSGIRTTYYVYNKSIIVKQENIKKGSDEHSTVIYNGIDTSALILDTRDTTNVCDEKACYNIPKVVDAIKKSIHGKAAREYTRV